MLQGLQHLVVGAESPTLGALIAFESELVEQVGRDLIAAVRIEPLDRCFVLKTGLEPRYFLLELDGERGEVGEIWLDADGAHSCN